MNEKFSTISGVILSGGNNSRYGGKDKALIEINGRTIIENTLSVLNRVFSDVFIISNDPDKYSNIVDVPVYKDIHKNIGPLGGIHSALFNSKSESIFVIAADMPNVNEDLILNLIEKHQSSTNDILIPVIDSKIEPLHALYNRIILEKLEQFIQQTDNYSIRSFFPLVDTHFFEIKDSNFKSSFVNINSPSDLLKYSLK